GGDRTYVAHNHGSTERTVTFSDGHELTVPPRSTATGNGSGSGGQDPEPSTGNTFRLRSGGALTTGTGGASASDTVASSEGRNHDGTPNKPLVYEAKGVNATL
ncbi:glycoside hydrolase, partial [Streptomyces fulvissimus]|nr:glycoside hydrolase [Streptomyces microflavus]